MSDFLTRMAQLSRGEAAVVAPRLPSLFAPTREFGLAATSLDDSAGKTQQAATVAVDNDLPQATTRDGLAAEQPISPNPATRPDDKTVDALKPLIAPQDIDHTERTNIAEPLVSHNQDVPVKEQRSRSNGQDDLVSPQLNDEPHVISATTNIDKSIDSTEATIVQQQSVLPKLSMPLVPDYQNKQAAPQQVMAELQATIEQTATQEPVVHINIGRVEVRAHTATPAPARPSVQPKSQSSLSLNDYLKRGGGQT